MPEKKPAPPILPFATSAAFEKWLQKHVEKEEGIWLQLYKKASGKKTITYAEAVDVALCYGWIDGQKQSYDEKSFLQKFTPRRARSMWSKTNREHVARLIKEKRMQPSGLKQVELAKADGRWDQAYDSPKNMTVPQDFLKALSKDKNALEFFKGLTKANVYAIVWRLQTAKKPETRERRMKILLEMMKKGEKLH
jgi:uncharacterized protein YdeI (YjbR/CyaY-like superfamily)